MRVCIRASWLLSALSCVSLILVLVHAGYAYSKIPGKSWHPVSCSLVFDYALQVDAAMKQDEAFATRYKLNLRKVVTELEHKAGCDGQVHVSRIYGCYCVPEEWPRKLLGDGGSELIILKSTPFVAFLLIFVRILQWWWFSERPPGGLPVSCRTRVWGLVVHAQQAWCSLVKRMLCSGKLKDEELRREVEKQRCRYAGMLTTHVSTCLVIAMIGMVVFLNTEYPITSFVTIEEEMRAGSDQNQSIMWNLGMHLTDSWILPAFFTCSVLLVVNRQAVPTPKSLDRANVAVSCMWIWRYCTLFGTFYDLQSPLIWAGRIITGFIFGNPRLTMGLQGVITLVDILCHDAHGDGLSETTRLDLDYIYRQVGVFLLAAALAVSFEDLMISEVEALVEARRLNCVSSLVQRLLAAMCDCTVHLDTDLRIARPCPRLASLLMRPSAATPMLAQAFVEFLPLDDRPRFTGHVKAEMMQQGVTQFEGSPARPLHLSLLDSNQCLVPVEVFSSFIEDTDGASFHLVGIKEVEAAEERANAFVDTSHHDADWPSASSIDILMKQRRGQPPECNIDSVHENTSCSGDDRASNLSTGSVADIACSLSLDTFSAQPRTLPIMDWTIGFSTMVGPSAKKGIDFIEWIDAHDLVNFNNFISHEVNRFIFEGSDMDEGDNCLIGLRPPGLNRHKMIIQARVSLTFPRGPDSGADSGTDSGTDDLGFPLPGSVMLHFHSVSWHQGPRLVHSKRRANPSIARLSKLGTSTSPKNPQKASLLDPQVFGAESHSLTL